VLKLLLLRLAKTADISLSAFDFSLYHAHTVDEYRHAMLKDYLKVLPHYLLPKKALTTLAGLLADIKVPAVKNYLIQSFIKKYAIDMSEAREEDPKNYACFNDFFIRQLKPDCRLMTSSGVISPVDGTISEIGDIHSGMLLQAKNQYYSVEELLACDPSMSSRFDKGRFVTLYLSPKDYHRVHMPIQATLNQMIHIPGKLFSVKPLTTRTISGLFSHNERLVVLFNTKVGPMAMVMVGATIVGSIATSWHGDVLRCKQSQLLDYTRSQMKPIQLQQGAEMGHFKLGSTVILLFAEGPRLRWQPQLKAGSGVHLYQALAELVKDGN
jgi:phosphatidylserine decarboxylase